jgi:hypothetical protein
MSQNSHLLTSQVADLDVSALEKRYEKVNAKNDELTVVEEDKKEAVREEELEANVQLARASANAQVSAPEPSECLPTRGGEWLNMQGSDLAGMAAAVAVATAFEKLSLLIFTDRVVIPITPLPQSRSSRAPPLPPRLPLPAPQRGPLPQSTQLLFRKEPALPSSLALWLPSPPSLPWLQAAPRDRARLPPPPPPPLQRPLPRWPRLPPSLLRWSEDGVVWTK